MASLNLCTSTVVAGRALALSLFAVPALASPALAAAPVALGTAGSFALLAGSTITNTGSTTVTGDIGLCCTGIDTTGFGPGADAVNHLGFATQVGTGSPAATAQDDLDIAYGDAAGRAVTNTVQPDLSLTGTPANPLAPGVYQSTSHGALEIDTGLTLDFQGDPNAVFIFQGSSLLTAAGPSGSVQIVNGGAAPSACNIFWQLSDATQGVTLGSGSALKGTTMSLGASVLGTAATVDGRILTRRSKAVNLDTNTITRPQCSSAGGSAGGGDTSDGAPSPRPTPVSGNTPGRSRTPAPATRKPPHFVAPAALRAPKAAVSVALTGARRASASIAGPGGPVSGPFEVVVTGRAIAQVTFSLDGRKRATVRATRRGQRRFKLVINPNGQSRRVHRVTARVSYRAGSSSSSATRRLVYRRVAAGPRMPRFAG